MKWQSTNLIGDLGTKQPPGTPWADGPGVYVLRVWPHQVTERPLVWDLLVAFNRSDLVQCLDVRRESTVDTQDLLVDKLLHKRACNEMQAEIVHFLDLTSIIEPALVKLGYKSNTNIEPTRGSSSLDSWSSTVQQTAEMELPNSGFNWSYWNSNRMGQRGASLVQHYQSPNKPYYSLYRSPTGIHHYKQVQAGKCSD